MSNADLESLLKTGWVRNLTHIPGAMGEPALLTMEIRRGDMDDISELQVKPFGLTLLLSSADCTLLASNGAEGVYLRREWTNGSGQQIRFVTYIEKDKKTRKHDRSREISEPSKAELL